MKFALLTTRIGFISLITSSLTISNVLAADQGNNPGKIQNQPMPFVITNGSKQNTTATPGGFKLQVPPTPAAPAIKSKQSASASTANQLPVGEQVVLQSRDIGSFGPRWQTFSDYLTVPKGCEQIPLFITFMNGSGSAVLFQDLRISLAGKALATIKDFGGKALLTRNLTGALGVGDSLLTVQAYGPMGAKLNWKFTTQKIIVTKVNPNSFGPTDKVVVQGKNFSDRPNVTQVFIDNKKATIVSAKTTSLEIKPPTGLLSGKTTLVVGIGPLRSAAITVTIKGAPEILSVSNISTAPGQPFTITGSGFSTNITENQVTFGGFPAEITGCSPTTIECIVPMALDPQSPVWDVPIKVKTNGMEATDPEMKGKINIQSRVF